MWAQCSSSARCTWAGDQSGRGKAIPIVVCQTAAELWTLCSASSPDNYNLQTREMNRCRRICDAVHLLRFSYAGICLMHCEWDQRLKLIIDNVVDCRQQDQLFIYWNFPIGIFAISRSISIFVCCMISRNCSMEFIMKFLRVAWCSEYCKDFTDCRLKCWNY